MKKCNRVLTLACLSLFSIAISMQPVNASNVAVTPPKTNCYIKIDDPHFSEYFRRNKAISAVKINASSKCGKPISNLTLWVEIYKTGKYFDHEVAKSKFTKFGNIRPNQVIRNQKTYVECLNSKETDYYGVAYAEAMIAGKIRSTPRVYSAKTFTFACGT